MAWVTERKREFLVRWRDADTGKTKSRSFDASFRQVIFEVVEGFECAAPPVVSSDTALARDVSHKSSVWKDQ
jgi:hypothetical protein